MIARKHITASAPWLLAVMLTACDPGVHVGWQKQFDGPIDPKCIEAALRSVSKDVRRGSYVSDGGRGFPEGTEVTQFNYSDPSYRGDYSLEVARLPTGQTNYFHQWGKIGTNVPASERAVVLPLLYRANRAVAERCRLSFDDVIPEQGDG